MGRESAGVGTVRAQLCVADHQRVGFRSPATPPMLAGPSAYEGRHMLQFRWAARSHVGRVRTNNEDSGFAGPYLVMVADGVGGAAAGEVASASTTYLTAASSMLDVHADPLVVLGGAVTAAHRHLRQGVADDERRQGMATTMTAVLTDGARFGLAHVGDSRGYLLRKDQLSRVTSDHTLVQLLVDEGQLSAQDARTHPQRSVVLRSIDTQHEPEPDLIWLELEPGDRLLLCSDGLSDLVPDDQIAPLLTRPDPDVAAVDLVEAALAAGGRDNVTCIVADVVDAPPVGSSGTLVGAVLEVANLIDAAAVRAISSA